MKLSFQLVGCLLILGLVLCVSGCGNGMSSLTGKVTIDGEPVEGVFVNFDPILEEGNTATSPAGGNTDAEGNYTATFSSQTDGIMPGKYLVTVEGEAYDDEGNATTSIEIPAEWKDEPTHECVVEPGKKNVFNIEITTGK